jgi:hypothetical protein
VGEGGLEPPRPEGHWHLKPARLPFRHSPQQPGKTITHNTALPNRADTLPKLAGDPKAARANTADLLRSNSQNSIGHAATGWADTMQARVLARRHADELQGAHR